MPVLSNVAPLNPQPVNGTVAATQSGAWTVANSSTAFKFQSAVRVFGGTTATLTVPSGQIFRGTISGVIGVGTSTTGVVVRLRDTNVSGAILFGYTQDFGTARSPSSGDYATTYVELSAGTYFLETFSFAGGTSSQAVSIIGGLYANS
jgi:hypothetical protein